MRRGMPFRGLRRRFRPARPDSPRESPAPPLPAGTPAGAANAAPPPCPGCGARLDADENFCPACGAKIRSTLAEKRARLHRQLAAQEQRGHLQKINRGRGWLLVVCILTFVGGIYGYLSASSDLDQAIALVKAAGIEERQAVDAAARAETGLSWEETVSKARGALKAILVAHLILGGVYFGLYRWSERSPFPAAMIALILYVTVQIGSFIVNPEVGIKGWVIKGAIIVVLASAVTAAYKYSRMQRLGGRPRRLAASLTRR
jgi:hypothetical protein